jgi:hypothetical protein
MTLSGILWLLGMGLIFVGEQIIGEGTTRWAVDGVGLAVVLGSMALRLRNGSAADAGVRSGGLLALIFSAVATSSLLLYLLGTDDMVLVLGLADEARSRWQGVLGVLTPIVLIVGAMPMFFLDLVLSSNPVILPRGAARKAMYSGLGAALAIALVFPVNYLANHYNTEWDTAYFRTARPGDATRNLVSTLTKPVQVYLFFPAGNDVLEEMRPYFDELQADSDGLLLVDVKDQALDLGLAEELKLQDNGWVVLEEEGEPVKFKMRLEKDRAKRDLKRFDELFQKNLLKATRGQRVAYMITGHGEASHRTKDNDWRKLADLRKDLQNQSYKLDDLGVLQGLADGIPDDAELLILAAPMTPLLPEEVATIDAWVKDGGQLLLMTDAGSDRLTDLLDKFGLERIEGPVTDPQRKLRNMPGHFILTDRYGTHPAVDTLSKAKSPVLLPQPVGFVETDADMKHTVLLRTYGTAFSDANKDGRQDENEVAKVHNLAYAIEGGEGATAWRVIVIGSISFVSDQSYDLGWRTSPFLVIDSVRWLAGEESLIGETESEEDVKIVHTPEDQRWWFWGTILAVPVLVLLTGIIRVIRRRRSR